MIVDWGSSPVLLAYTLTHLLAAVLTAALAAHIARNYWHKPIGRMFTALVAATSVGVVGTVGRLFTVSRDGFVALTVLKYVGIGTAPVFFLFVALRYSGRTNWVTPRTVALGLAVPAVTLAGIATMPVHELFYTSFTKTPVGPLTAIAAPEVGPWYWAILVYDWGAIVIGTVVLLSAAFDNVRFYHNQLVILLLAVIVSWAANIAYAVFSWPHPVLDPTALGFAVADTLLAVGLFSTRMVDIAPAARSRVLDAIDDAVVVVDRADRVVDVNDAARLLIDGDSVIGKPAAEALPTAVVDSSREDPTAVVDSSREDPTTVEVTVDTSQRFFRHRQLPVGPDGTRGRVIVLTDVTEEIESRREVERTNEELETLNTRFQLALEATDTGVWEWDLTTDAIACDETTERLFGFESGASPGTPGDILDRVHDDDVSAVEDAIDTAVEDAVDTGTTYSVEFRVQVPDGDQRWVLARGVVEQDESGEPSRILGVQTDITDRKESQQAVEQARRQLRQIVDLVPDPLYVKNRDDEVLLSNEANAELHGLTPDEIEGRREREIESTVENIENFDPYRQREMEVIESGSPATFQEELTGPDGRRYVFQTTRIPFETADGDEDAVLGYARDVTELKVYEQELEATKQTLAASNEKLEQTNDDLETLNRILRHDVRNDAVVLARFGRKLEQHVDEDGREHLQQLLQRAEHIRDLTTGLRDLMQTTLEDQRNLRPIRLDTVLEAQIRDVSDAYENAVVTVAGDLPQVSVRADRMLASVFGNVLQNAVQHNDSDVPKVTVSVEEREHRTEVRISDNGPGIPDDIADDIFGKGEHGLESKGTGIGLYLVSQLLEAYGGDIRLADDTRRDTPDDRSAAGDCESRGAEFVVELETVTAKAQQPAED